MYRRVENEWIPYEDSFKTEVAHNKIDLIMLFTSKVNELTQESYIYGKTLFPGDMLWAYHHCMTRKGAQWLILSNRTIDVYPVGGDPKYIKENIRLTEEGVIRGFYYFKRTGNHATMTEYTYEDFMKGIEG